jgi:hypothetical protein
MRFRLFIAGLSLLTLAPATLPAQVLITARYKCAGEKLAAIRAFNDTAFVAIAQELVDEGKLTGAGTAYHLWGDEWNVLYWYTAEDIPTYLDAFNELLARLGQRYYDAAVEQVSWCTEHQDNMYSSGAVTTPAPDSVPEKPSPGGP